MEQEIGSRRTGKTSRLLLKALLAASEGKQVIVFTDRADDAMWMHNLFCSAVTALGWCELDQDVCYLRRSVSFSWGGSVTFKVRDRDCTARWDDGDDMVRMYDHAAIRALRNEGASV